MIPTLEWTREGVRFLDQTRLPLEETYVLATSYQQVADVITTMVVRGAPAIGVSAAMGVALGVAQSTATTLPELTEDFNRIAKVLAATRPTAVNLFWAIERMRVLFNSLVSPPDIPSANSIDEMKQALIAVRQHRSGLRQQARPLRAHRLARRNILVVHFLRLCNQRLLHLVN